MLTADTITDEQIRELHIEASALVITAGEALGIENVGPLARHRARARCAEILNARAPKEPT